MCLVFPTGGDDEESARVTALYDPGHRLVCLAFDQES